ncbi:tRNA uridine-5-carboxymethylaminomethyl(34) synthesis GTPase MnmE [Stakelama sp. CBK3Z-3]|uniref:tRNA modification GTPase MnmE n=1 Tax=Stakelama flava TaxID=2860338 RepID=A0ABS6XLP1_9SPHN|nr:tRNA uridine-5-carboxymethylaminomethyl(34) synthesis GTPase MnmE [Stakelama flava]MBW4330718.1 tRNA uridine-5-carboxymethylaminomethyl(34) synthesis GTPase MnmE [Stakelama flava]
MDTIFALSSGAPPAGIAVMRISGPNACRVASEMAGSLPAARQASLRTLRSQESELLDRAMLLWFAGPASATGQDVVEFHLHGGRAVVAAVEAALSSFADIRRAEPGEFTRQALLSGKIDLTEAEGLADLLGAETETARRAAMQTSGGSVRRLIEEWTTRVLLLAAEVEAELDHGDEGDVAVNLAHGLARRCATLADEMDVTLSQPEVERIRDGIHVVLAGPPNAGKSTLLNRMADREVAIVSPIAGTTRDRIEAAVQRNGIAYVLSDTAGLADQTADVIERIGIERARAAMADCDVIVWLDDAPVPQELAAKAIAVTARCDLPDRIGTPERLSVSGASGEGIGALWERIEQHADALTPRLDGPLLNRRQRTLLGTASSAVRHAGLHTDALLLAEELRTARTALDRISGRADVEAVLDGVFSRFCIGK